MRENINQVVQVIKEGNKLCQFRQGLSIVSFPFSILMNEPISARTNNKIIVPSNADQKLPNSTHIQINMPSVNIIFILSSSFIVAYFYYNIKKLFHFSKNFLAFKEKII